jgi:hypothetical protein
VEPSLEKFAREKINATNAMYRVEGIKALRYFKSAANIKLLKPLLNDPAFQDWFTQNVVWKTKRSYYTRQAAYEVLQEWGVPSAKPLMEEDLPWRFDPAVRQNLPVQIPTRLWIHDRTNAFEMGASYDDIINTNVMTGSNMITGTQFKWFVYPEGHVRPATSSRLELDYWPTCLSRVQYFERAKDGLPVQGQKYIVEVDFTLFETDNPPADPDNVSGWSPQDGKNYQVLLQRTLRETCQIP